MLLDAARNITPSRPVMRYHGSKWRIAPWLISHFPRHTMYVEPFGGGASVLLRKPPSTIEVYNDLDEEIVNVFRVLRDAALAAELKRQMELTPYARAEYDSAYSPFVRSCAASHVGGQSPTDAASSLEGGQLPATAVGFVDCPVERARRVLVKAFMGFGSNSATARLKSGFARRYKDNNGVVDNWVEYPAHIEIFTRRLRPVTIECRPALEILRRYDSGNTFFYVDPPYVRSTRTTNGQSYRHEMTDEQHGELATALRNLQGMAIISGYDCPLYQNLYADWRRVTMETRGDKCAPRTECLWISPNAAKSTPQKSLLEMAV